MNNNELIARIQELIDMLDDNAEKAILLSLKGSLLQGPHSVAALHKKCSEHSHEMLRQINAAEARRN